MQRSVRWRILAVLPLVGLVGGCGGGERREGEAVESGGRQGEPVTSSAPPAPAEDSSTTVPPSSASVTTRAPEPASSVSDDEALARRIPLTVEDLPAGYEQAPQSKTGADSPDPFESCDRPGLEALDKATARAQSPVFSLARDNALLSVGSAVAVYPNVELADRALAVLGPEDGGRCLAEFVARQAAADPEAPKVGDPTVAALAFTNLGQSSAALRVNLELAAEGGAVPLVTDFVFVRMGRAVATLAFSGVGEPFSPDEAVAIAARLVDRM